MAVTPAYEFPKPLMTEFNKGEYWITSSQIINNIPAGRFFFAKKLVLPISGTYRIKIYVDDTAAVSVGKDFMSSQLVLTAYIGYGVAEYEVYMPEGEQRLSVEIQNLTANTEAGFIFSLWMEDELVYASQAVGWVWSTDPIVNDDEVPSAGDLRKLLPVFTITPNWQTGIVERLSWLTDVLESETGAEQRRSLRNDPRRSFEANFLRADENRAMLDAFLTTVGQGEALVPLWHEVLTMTDGINVGSPGVDFANGMGSYREFKANGLVLVNNGSPNNYDVLEVAQVFEDRFTWRQAPLREWPPGTRVYPLRAARIMDSTSLDAHSERAASVQIRFELSDADDFPASWFDGEGGIPIFTFKPNRAAPIPFTYTRLTNVLDNQTGRIEVTDIAENTAVGIQAAFTFFGREAVWNWRRLMSAAKGRLKNFYFSTYMQDLIPLYDEITDDTQFLMLRPTGIGRFTRRMQSARHAVILYPQEGPRVFRKILAVEPQYITEAGALVNYETDQWYDRVYLDAPLPAMKSASIARICYVSESRFDNDSFELAHVSSTSVAVTTSATIRQLPNRRMRTPDPVESPEWPSPYKPVTGIITLKQTSVHDLHQNFDTPNTQAQFFLRSDGLIQTRCVAQRITSTPGTWTDVPSEAALWEVKVEKIGGNGNLAWGSLDLWESMSSTRGWAVAAFAPPGAGMVTQAVILRVTFRDKATLSPVAPIQVSLIATSYNQQPAP